MGEGDSRMNQGTPIDGSGCTECGAAVGHRTIELQDVGGTSGYRACSLGQDSVPRAEHEKTKKYLLEACEQKALYFKTINKVTRERDEALRDTEVLYRTIVRLADSRRDVLANLTTTQARCTELLEEVRALKFAAAQKRVMEDHKDLLTALKDCTCEKENDPMGPCTTIEDCYKHGADAPYCGAV